MPEVGSQRNCHVAGRMFRYADRWAAMILDSLLCQNKADKCAVIRLDRCAGARTDVPQ